MLIGLWWLLLIVIIRCLLLCTCSSYLVLVMADQGWTLHLAAVHQQHYPRTCPVPSELELTLPWRLQGRQELLDDIMAVLIQLAASKQFTSALASSVSREISDALKEDVG